MKHVYGCLVALFLAAVGFAQDQAQPQSLDTVVTALKDGTTTLQRNLLIGKRYRGMIIVEDVEGSGRVAIVKSESVGRDREHNSIRISFQMEDIERALKIRKKAPLTVTGTLRTFDRTRYMKLQISGTYP